MSAPKNKAVTVHVYARRLNSKNVTIFKSTEVVGNDEYNTDDAALFYDQVTRPVDMQAFHNDAAIMVEVSVSDTDEEPEN